ncbi:hypothetical protein EYC84_000160 [Monilinia fructicola]|uniref:Uncharacterized protein n=1 Tax=Monilinia fructicola TaxID=38448 RepID=A0A5M9JSE5_MONFR|nr:hypothetical protein EYC84_000160 [Monilinia fructicola]
MTSVKKIEKITKAAKKLDCAVLLKTGRPPGVMLAEGEVGKAEEWLDVVKNLRYKNFELMKKEGVEERRLGIPAGKVRQLESLKDYGIESGTTLRTGSFQTKVSSDNPSVNPIMDQSNSVPVTAWPTFNESSSNLPPYSEEPPIVVSLPQRNSEWFDDNVTTAYPQSPLQREDHLASFFPTNATQVATSQLPAQSPTSAYPPTPISSHGLQVSGYESQSHMRRSPQYSEYEYEVPVPRSARFERDLQHEIFGSPSSVYADNELLGFSPVFGEQFPFSLEYKNNARLGNSQSPRIQASLLSLTQSPAMGGTSELFPEFDDIHSNTAPRTTIPQANSLPQSHSEQPHIEHLHPQGYQQSLARPSSSKSKPPTRTARSSSIITGLDQGIFRSPGQRPHNLQNLDNFYPSQKDDSRLSRPLSSNKEHVPRRNRASSLERTSVPTNPDEAKIWDARMDAGQPSSNPIEKTPTYQEFRQISQRVDTLRSDQIPLRPSAISQYQRFAPDHRPPRESDWRFDPKMVQDIYVERWKISQGYEHLQGYLNDPKEGIYKDLSWEEWVELYNYLGERDKRAMEREIMLGLKSNRGLKE